ncbi:uncharacterized protein LTR77_006794 [Saxophila tyrrhenica]|uniref:Serine aminopeptidase S33 domain-containing protein n=1 Tax=Saxophila tyrrhenica TaxID=1690608 RepID=A0AAV9P980_9PEZI|nr:hypothetical protein LTR77_006794 [Saxophila tyrrhenica]
MTAYFNVQEHRIPTTHIREYPRALADDQDDVLQLAVKQYTPKESKGISQQAVTCIGAHANGFPKELYEPLWDELYSRLRETNIYISSIWIADVAHQGTSGVLNEEKLGNDPSWADHPRDLFLMINHFRKHMQRPLIGIGHSMGGCNLVNLSLMHPRLFTTLILIDPVIQRLPSAEGNLGPASASIRRREVWPSRAAAAEKLRSSPFYQKWDSRVLDRWIQYGLRDTPTYIHPNAASSRTATPIISADPIASTIESDREVTLTTTKHQEVMTFLRPNLPTKDYPHPEKDPNPLTHPDIDPSASPNSPFYNPVPIATFHKLPFVRPSVFYIFGDPAAGAFLSAPVMKADKLAHTGTGVGGSGGVKKLRVSSVTFDGVGHLIPMEIVGRTADACTNWLVPELQRWRNNEERARKEWAAVPKRQKAMLSEEYVKAMTGDLKGKAGGRSRL